MSKLTEAQKKYRKRERMIEAAKKYTIGTYARKVAQVFQQMIRAEAAALPDGLTPAVVDGTMTNVFRRVGQCVCVTCGKVLPWKNPVNRYSGMHTGHFLASRRNSILFAPDNVAPQCSSCNYFKSGSGQEYRLWMLSARGARVVEDLEHLKEESVQFSKEQLVDMKLEFQARLKSAEKEMSSD